MVNGKPALEWVMERQVVKTDKASGIINDANDYANETVGNPRYPLELRAGPGKSDSRLSGFTA